MPLVLVIMTTFHVCALGMYLPTYHVTILQAHSAHPAAALEPMVVAMSFRPVRSAAEAGGPAVALPAAVVLDPVLLPAAGASSSTGGAGCRSALALRSAVRLVGRVVSVPSCLMSVSCGPREEGATPYI